MSAVLVAAVPFVTCGVLAGPVYACAPTESNTAGPFYRSGAPWRRDLAGDAAGQRLHVTGQVLDSHCRPIPHAILDLWQADAHGQYDNDSPTFRLRGRVRTDERGRYSIETVMPGNYLLGGRLRAAHIHFKVSGSGRELTTQLFFAGDPHLKGDPLVRSSCIVPVDRSQSWKARFDIVLG